MSLLFNPIIRATMTQEMIAWEKESGLFPSWIINENKNKCYVESDGKVMLKAIKDVDASLKTLNFDRGSMAKYVADTVLCEVDRQKSRERSQKRKREGETRKNRILKIQKKLTAGKLVLDGGSHHLDENVLAHVERRRKEQEEAVYNRRQREDLEYMKWCYKADEVIDRYGDTDVSKWKKKDEIIAYLRPLKRNGDSALPVSRRDAEQRYRDWQQRHRREIEENDDLLEKFGLWLSEQKDKDSDKSNDGK